MPHYIVKLETPKGPRYLDWSTIVDAPVTYGMTLDDFKAYYRERFGSAGMLELPAHLARVEAKGASALNYESADEVIAFNRAGPNETCLTKAQLIESFCAS